MYIHTVCPKWLYLFNVFYFSSVMHVSMKNDRWWYLIDQGNNDKPFTDRMTSVSATPIWGTMALHVYVPSSSRVTDFNCKVLPWLRTWVEKNSMRTNKGLQGGFVQYMYHMYTDIVVELTRHYETLGIGHDKLRDVRRQMNKSPKLGLKKFWEYY